MRESLVPIYNQLKKLCADNVSQDKSLASLISFGVGNSVKYFCYPPYENNLSFLIKFLYENNVPYFVIGKGTNLLVSDKGFDGVVIKLGDGFKDIEFDDHNVSVGCGCSLVTFIDTCIDHSLSGLEALYGIPGSVGGAVKMNAGAWGSSFGDYVYKINAIDKFGNKVEITTTKDDWSYRGFNKTDLIFTKAFLTLTSKDKNEIRKLADEYMTRRQNNQPLSERSAGCVFKNPKVDEPASLIIDRLGLKGEHIGGAYVSEKHANFIVARDNAKADDIYKLIKRIQAIVKEKINIELETEIIFLGEFENEI